MCSRNYYYELREAFGVSGHTILSNSECMSTDVAAAFDSKYADAFEANNIAHLGYGTVIVKYTGRAGKAMASDVFAEFTNKVTRFLDKEEIS